MYEDSLLAQVPRWIKARRKQRRQDALLTLWLFGNVLAFTVAVLASFIAIATALPFYGVVALLLYIVWTLSSVGRHVIYHRF